MRILRTADVISILGISRSTLWRWEKSPDFPPKVRLGPNTVGWCQADILEWLDGKSHGAFTRSRYTTQREDFPGDLIRKGVRR